MKTTMSLKTTSDLRQVLADTIGKVQNKSIGTDEAQAIAQLCSAIVRSADLDLKAMKYVERYNGTLGAGTVLIEDQRH